MILCYNKPANMSYLGWETEALPLGNGKIGAKVFGGVECELIHFNEKTLWSGGSEVPGWCAGIKNADKGAALKKIQCLLDEGQDKQATAAMSELEGDMAGFGNYQSFGNLYLNFGQKGAHDKYTRDLELDSASSMVSYVIGKTTYVRHYFISYPDNVFVGRILAEGEDASLDLDAYFVSDQKGESKAQGNTITVCGHVMANVGTASEAGSDQNSMKYGGVFRLIPTEGTATATEDGHIKIEKAKSVLIIASLATDYINDYPHYFSGEDPLAKAKETVDKAAKKSFGELYRTHLADYKALYDRVKFTLGEEEIVHTTDFMLRRFEKKGENKRNLITLLFQYARYLLIASSREGSLPANLQGIWNAKNDPPWSSDYHFNVNVQMNYWGAYVAGLAETALPYIDFVNSLRKPGRVVANRTMGIGQDRPDGEADYEKPTGWVIHTMVNPLGFVGPGSNWRWGWSPANGAWALQNMFDYYLFTGDTEKLSHDIYPAMAEAARMWTQLLIEDKKTGRLVCSPGFSPEHGPVAAGNTYDQCIIYNLYEDTIAAAKALKEAGYEVDEELDKKLKEQILLLKPLHVGKWGQIKEWYHEDSFFRRGFFGKGVEKKHRHISHLLALYPFRQIKPEDEALSKAALVTLEDRGYKSTGWGLAIRLLSYARLQEGERCDKIIENIIKTAILKNLFGTHPPFQIDGNFGLMAGICEMLLQSHAGYIHILPALPSSWFEGEIDGIRARGNFEVSIVWKDRKLKNGTVKSHLGGECAMKYDGKIILVTDEEGNEVKTEFQDGITRFVAEKGKTYQFS